METNKPYQVASHGNGDGAPQGDPFVNEAPSYPQAYTHFPVVRGRETPRIGRGPPPNPSRHGRSVSIDSPTVAQRHASGNPMFFDPAVTPTPNRTGYPAQHVHAPQNVQYGLATDQNTQLLYTLLGKMDTVLDENRNLVSSVGELKQRVTMLEQGGYALQAGRRRGPQRGRPVTRMQSTRRPVSQQSENDSDDFIDPVLRAVEALDGASETTTETEFSEDADDTASIADGYNGGPVVIDDGTLTRGERKATRLRISQIFRQVCNVFGKEWPAVSELRVNPITKRQYPTPNFNSDVLHPDNCALFRKVGLRAQVVLSVPAWPKALKRLKTLKDPIVWDLDFTTECAKKSFCSYKKQWQAQATIEGWEKAEEKEKRDRRTQRRVLKSEQIKKISDAVAEENDMDAITSPTKCLASTPTPKHPKTHENWKFRMATIAKLPKDPASLKNTHFLEVLVSEWRAEAVIHRLVHSLQRRYKKNGKGGSAQQYHRVCAVRRSTRIPRYAPYNSGIKQDWFEDVKKNPDLALQVEDWGRYETPDGCEFKSIPLPA
ncbi:hypothetical protein B0H14DRAFT_2795389 [Mycena olivaceomarginata]|nr:hypothetical protein B0H14DRAFT_2795389 [Mycena olivaceomarginata]